MGQAKIFIRKRRLVQEGDQAPRFVIVAVAGADISFKVRHIRKKEIEQIAEAIGAELIVLETGSGDNDHDHHR